MRIVGGSWRGRALKAPLGRATRPTQDRVREALASMAASALDLSFGGVTVLDPFCGSGAIALELLSRGARGATLIDNNARALAVARANVEALQAKTQTVLLRGDAFKALDERVLDQAPFGVVVLDPPYASNVERLQKLVVRLAARHALAPDALVIHERAREGKPLDEAPLASLGFVLKSSKTYGESALDLWSRSKKANTQA